jgi:hypothetical protein
VSDPNSPFNADGLPTQAVPAQPAMPGDEPPLPPSDPPGTVPWVPVVLAALAVIALGVIVLFLLDDDGDDAGTTTVAAPTSTVVEQTTTSALATTTTAADTTTTAAETTTSSTPPVQVDYDAVVFPVEGSGVAFNDPVVAARAFAVDYLGFTNPVVSRFNAGDSASGEVEVRAVDTGVPTIVLLRTFGDTGQWFVTGASNENIVVDTPEPGRSSPARCW